MPCPEPLHCSHIYDYIYDFCRLPDPDVGLSVIGVVHLSLQADGKVAFEDIPVFDVLKKIEETDPRS